jgi:hypothetical protein
MLNRWQHSRDFVLRLHSGTNAGAGRFEGHVEHVASGEALRFQSLEELLAFLTRVLSDADQKPAEER